MAYNIIELNEKLTTELRVLAKEMGIRRPDAYKKEELIYKISFFLTIFFIYICYFYFGDYYKS